MKSFLFDLPVKPVEPRLNLEQVVFLTQEPNRVTQPSILGVASPSGIEGDDRPWGGIRTPAQVIDLILGAGEAEGLQTGAPSYLSRM